MPRGPHVIAANTPGRCGLPRVAVGWPLAGSQSRTVRSLLALASWRPSGDERQRVVLLGVVDQLPTFTVATRSSAEGLITAVTAEAPQDRRRAPHEPRMYGRVAKVNSSHRRPPQTRLRLREQHVKPAVRALAHRQRRPRRAPRQRRRASARVPRARARHGTALSPPALVDQILGAVPRLGGGAALRGQRSRQSFSTATRLPVRPDVAAARDRAQLVPRSPIPVFRTNSLRPQFGLTFSSAVASLVFK
jgi:hypothetical protein